MLLEGLKIANFRLQGLIGSDGIIETYLALDSDKEFQATIKVIRIDFTSNDDSVKEAASRFLSEAKSIAQLNHPNILPLSGFGEVNIKGVNLPYIITPLRREEDLSQRLRQRRNAPLAPKEVAHIVHQAAAALQYAHDRRIIHQDVKPANFLIPGNSDNPNYPRLLLTNFVLSSSPNTTGLPGNVRGTPTYMAPEQWNGQPLPASDQYALAGMTYELLTGRPPFQGTVMELMNQHLNVEPQPPNISNPQLSTDIDFVLLHALAKRPERRFGSIAAFDRAFQNATQEPETLPPNAADVEKQRYTASTHQEPEILSPNVTVGKVEGGGDNPNKPAEETPPTRSPARLSLLTKTLVAVAVLVLIGSSLIYYFNIYRPNQFLAQSTATAQANMTATAQANAFTTATAQAFATSQARAAITATALQNNFNQITGRPPAFSDAMASPNDTSWNSGVSGRGGCNFAKGAYQVTATVKPVIFPCYAKGLIFGNVVYQVKMQITQGDYGGLFFRIDPLRSVGYGFLLAIDGSYAIDAYLGPTVKPKQLLGGQYTPLFRDQTYQIAVVAQGNTFSLYINGTYLGSTQDSSATSTSGIIGLAAGTIMASTADIAYSQVQVWQL